MDRSLDRPLGDISAAVRQLDDVVRSAAFHLDIPGRDEAELARRGLVDQIQDYVLPRLEQIDAPLLAVVGGSTGAGKSTLVNSIIGRAVSPAGVLRPTTTTPTIVSHPADLDSFHDDRILPDLPRLTGKPRQGDRGVNLVADDDLPRGLALLDAPDIDSVVAENRLLADQLLAAADMWLFTTTAARYADAVPWSLLRAARDRGTAMALVLNRVPEEALDEVPRHLREMLTAQGLGEIDVLTIPEVRLEDGLLPGAALGPLRTWLGELASSSATRTAVIRSTLEGALRSLPPRAASVADHLDAQRAAADALSDEATRAYETAIREIEGSLGSAATLRGEVLARWHEFIGTADLMRNIQSAIGRARDRIGDVLMGRPPVDAQVRSAVESSIEVAVVAACEKAADAVHDAWAATPYGRALLDQAGLPSAPSDDIRDRIDVQVREWQGFVLDLVAQEGQSKRTLGRVASIGVNAVGAALMVVIFAQTGGLTGGEVAVAGGTAALSQRLLEALFGDQAVRDLTTKARVDLMGRLEQVLDAEAARFEVPARAAGPPDGASDRIGAAAADVADAIS